MIRITKSNRLLLVTTNPPKISINVHPQLLKLSCRQTAFLAKTKPWQHSRLTVRYRWTHAAFHASVLRPASQAGTMHESAGVGQVSWCCTALDNEACMSVWCSTLLSSELINPACVQARSSNLTSKRVGLMGRDSWGGGRDIQWHCTSLVILPSF